MRLTSFLQDGTLTIILTGEIDHHCAKEYIGLINGKIESYCPSTCILDFQEVTFMDSSGIAVVINALRTITHLDGVLQITGLRHQPMKVFKTSGVDKLVKMREITA